MEDRDIEIMADIIRRLSFKLNLIMFLRDCDIFNYDGGAIPEQGTKYDEEEFKSWQDEFLKNPTDPKNDYDEQLNKETMTSLLRSLSLLEHLGQPIKNDIEYRIEQKRNDYKFRVIDKDILTRLLNLRKKLYDDILIS